MLTAKANQNPLGHYARRDSLCYDEDLLSSKEHRRSGGLTRKESL